MRKHKDKNEQLREGLLLPAVMLAVQLKELSRLINHEMIYQLSLSSSPVNQRHIFPASAFASGQASR